MTDHATECRCDARAAAKTAESECAHAAERGNGSASPGRRPAVRPASTQVVADVLRGARAC